MRRCFSSTYLHFFLSMCLLGERRCVVFLSRVHMRALSYMVAVCLYPGAVLPPIRSQVFIRLDSGRQITRPQAATHPSLRGLPETAFNTHLLILAPLQNKIFGCLLLDHPRASRGSEGLQSCIFSGTTLFSLNLLPSLHAALNDTLSRVQCLT